MADETSHALPDDDLSALKPRRSKAPLAIGLVVALVALASFWAYLHIEQKGLPVHGEGHVVRLPDGSAWAFLLDGTLVEVTRQSADRLKLQSIACTKLEGYLKDEHYLELETAECDPSVPLVRKVGERMRRAGMKFAYWDKSLQSTPADQLEPALRTVELYAAVVDPRASDPQLIWLYTPLFPTWFGEARARGGFPPPVIVQIHRNDLLIKRLSRTEVARLLSRDRLILAAAATKGGWLVRQVDIVGNEPPFVERLLIAPEEEPWPQTLTAPTLRLGRRTPSPAAGEGLPTRSGPETAGSATPPAPPGGGQGGPAGE